MNILGPGGAVATALGDRFESRPQQVEMAIAVAAAMQSKSHLLAEAGTGVGKSFAYLVPAMIRAAQCGETVLVSTHTIALQEQLITKDIPLLTSILFPEVEGSSPIRPVLVKGRGNYLSIRRLRLASERQERQFQDPAARRSLRVIEDWAYETEDGSTSSLPQLERGGVWGAVQSDSANCMGRKCPTYESCFYQRARAQLEGANLLVCNHALFFSDLALRSQEAGFLPVYHHVILDEAHAVEDVASEHFGLALAEGRVNRLLTSLYSPRGSKGYLPQLQLAIQDTNEVARALSLVDEAQSAARAFFEGVIEFIKRSNANPSKGPIEFARVYAGQSARIREAGAVSNVITPAFRELALRLKALREAVRNEQDKFELNAFAVRVEGVAVEAEALVSQLVPGAAYWAECEGAEDDDRFGGPRVKLACSPVDVAPILKEHLFKSEYSVTLASATLSTRMVRKGESVESSETAFSHTLARLGCEGAKTVQLGSPFDYARQVELYVDAVDDRSRIVDGLSPLSQAILRHVEATDGGAFVLFTSFQSLNKCASELAGPLAERGNPLLAQGRDGSRTLILQRFREDDRSVLFGAASFWQGVDVRGRNLRNVIITKLPFDPPDRPLNQARCEKIEQEGRSPFMEDSLPRAIIRFKQGFGRLIRSADDHGRVAVLDGRIVTAKYGRFFLSALPEGVLPRVMGAEDV